MTAAPLSEATDELEAAVLLVANLSDDELSLALVDAFEPIGEAVSDTVPPWLVESRPGEPVQMAAHFISVELQPLVDAQAQAVGEVC